MAEFFDLSEKTISSEEVFDGRLLHVFNDTVSLPNGETAARELIRHVGAVAIVALTDDGKVIMEKQFRYPLGKVIDEIPAGKLNSKEEDRLEAAKRELEEETGVTADQWRDLGLYYPAAAYTDEIISLYLAQGLHYGNQHLDDDEFLEFSLVPLNTLVDEIIKGKIADGKTLAAILKTAFLIMNEE